MWNKDTQRVSDSEIQQFFEHIVDFVVNNLLCVSKLSTQIKMPVWATKTKCTELGMHLGVRKANCHSQIWKNALS